MNECPFCGTTWPANDSSSLHPAGNCTLQNYYFSPEQWKMRPAGKISGEPPTEKVRDDMRTVEKVVDFLRRNRLEIGK